MLDIVLIDDEANWLELHKAALEEDGHAVRAFQNGEEAIGNMEGQEPDVIVLDIRMNPSGRDMFRLIRRYWPHVPVLICSAYGGYRCDFDFQPASAFIVKSTDMAPLRGRIQAVMKAVKERKDRQELGLAPQVDDKGF